MVQASLDFFFDMIAWVFNTFLIRIQLFEIPILYYFLAILLLGIVINGLINRVSAGSLVLGSSRSRRSESAPDNRYKMDI